MNKKEKMYQQIRQHGENLKKLFELPENMDCVKLCKQLFKLETKSHKLTTAYCNGDINETTYNMIENDLLYRVNKVLNNNTIPIFINGDCRGYALKIKDDYIMERKIEIYKDFGGYGIIAPDFN